MQFKKFNRVAAALICGAIVASSGSVATFAATPNKAVTSGHFFDPTMSYTEYRDVKVVQPAHGRIVVNGIYKGQAPCDSEIYVTLIPDKGYTAAMNDRKQYFTTNNDVDWQGITKVSDNVYKFKMPWCDPKIGITIEANFVPAK